MAYSAVVLEFGEPIFQLMKTGAPRSTLRHAAMIVVTAWNGVIVDDALGTTESVDELRRSTAALPEPGAALFRAAVEELVDRRRGRLAEHRWTIGRWELKGTGGDLRLWIEAREAPQSAPASRRQP